MITIYLLVMTIVMLLRKNIKTKFFPYPELKIKDDGIYFNSTRRHKIYISNAKVMQVGTTVYLKDYKINVTLINVDRIYLKDGNLYFNGLGEVRVLCNMRRVRRYFAIGIKSEQLEFDKMRTKAKMSLINHLFNINECNELKEYLSLITRVLNIRLTDDRVVISKNKYNISYTLYYKINNVIKKVRIGEI